MFDEFLSDALANDLLESMWVEAMFAGNIAQTPGAPAANVEHTENNIDIRVALPGLSRSDIDVTVEGGVLTVSTSDQRTEDCARPTGWSSYGTTSAWALPVGVQLQQISSRYEAGVLTVSIPHEPTELLEIPVE